MKASTPCVLCEQPGLLWRPRSRTKSLTHCWPMNSSLSIWEDWLWISAQLWRHSPGTEEGRVWHISWINPTNSQWGDRCCGVISCYSRKLTVCIQGFCILLSINGQKNSTHLSLLMVQPRKTLHEVWLHRSTATQFDSYTNANVFTSLWKLKFCEHQMWFVFS